MKSKNFDEFVSKKVSNFENSIDSWFENRIWSKYSKLFALQIIKTLRTNKELSQKDLAKKLGVSEQRISTICKGKENFTIKTMVEIQDALGIEIFRIMNVDKSRSKSEVDLTNYNREIEVDKSYINTYYTTNQYNDLTLVKQDDFKEEAA
jgi:transcriptional regulator with XRE-family HTH domain